MSFCSRIRGFSHQHEHVADLFSVLAVAVLFGTILGVANYHGVILSWTMENMVLHVPLLVLAIILDVTLIFLLLMVGTSRFGEEEEACFHTFRGRRHGGFSIGAVFHTWLDHVEHVNKKHR